MAFPTTRAALKEKGYRFDNHATCRGCQQDIEWHITPLGKKMPFNLMPTDESAATPHWATCANANEFRKGSTSR